MTFKYDYYIEPCQLCISRSGATYDKCGWCHDDDTYGGERDGKYEGNYIRIPNGGYGYPFHATPHKTRAYYRNDQLLVGMNGRVPSDCSLGDAKEEVSRNKAVNNILDLYKSGARPTWPVKQKHVNTFLDKTIQIERTLAYNPSGLDVTGKVEFRYLTYTLSKISSGKLGEILHNIRQYLSEEPKNYKNNLRKWKQAKQGGQVSIELLEVICHEAFHIIQAVELPAVGIRFDAERRLSLLKLVLVEDYFMDREATYQYGCSLYELLNYLDEETELYHYISRLFGFCRSDIELISHYTDKNNIGINFISLYTSYKIS